MTINAIFTTPVQSREWVSKTGAKGITHTAFFVEASASPLEQFQGEMSVEIDDAFLAEHGKNIRGSTAKIIVRAFSAMRNNIVVIRGDLLEVKKAKAA